MTGPPTKSPGRGRALVHLTTTDMSLALLLGPQLEAFAGAGYEVVGVSAPGPYVAELQAAGIHHVALRHASRSVAPLDDLRALFEVRSVLRRLHPLIVHTHNPKPGIYGRLAARAAGVPVIVNTVHGLYALPSDPIAKRASVYGLERMAAACSHAELVQNPEDLEVLVRLGVPRARLHLLGNGVDLDRFDPARAPPQRVAEVRAALGVGPDEVVCGVVGRMVWEKGYRDIFAAARALRATAPRIRFVVIGPDEPDKGDGVPEEDLTLAREQGGVSFLGARHDMEDLYAAMDIFALASLREGFPRSAMEAAAMGVPIVATDIRGCREVVDDDRTGHLVPPNDPSALAAAIAGLADDAPRRAAMGRAALAKARREFDQCRVIDTTLRVYADLLSRRPEPARP